MEDKTITIVWFRVYDREWTEVFKETHPSSDVNFYKNKILVKTHEDCAFHDIIQIPANTAKKLL